MSARSIQKFFPYGTVGMDWDSWNGNLAIFYSSEPIVFSSEDDWKTTASSLSGLPTFSSYPVPNPDLFATWQDWADEFTTIVNGPGR